MTVKSILSSNLSLLLGLAWLHTPVFAADLTWEGSVNSTWDTSTSNWVGTSTIWTNGDDATFDNTGTPGVISVTGPTSTQVVANSITFDEPGYTIEIDRGSGAAGSYRLTIGAGGIQGTAGATFRVDGSAGERLIFAPGAGTTMTVASNYAITGANGNKTLIDLVNAGGTVEQLIWEGTITLSDDADVPERNAFRVGGPEDILILNGQVTGNSDLGKYQNGTLILTNAANDFDDLAIAGGVLQVESMANAGVASQGGDGNLIIFGDGNSTGTLKLTGTGTTTNKQVRLNRNGTIFGTKTGGGVINNDGTGALIFTNAAFNEASNATSVGNRNLQLGGSFSGTNEIHGDIIDNLGGLISLSVDTSGTWTLDGNNTYSNGTAVINGRLNLTGTNVSDLTVDDGGILGGEGSTTGNVVIGSSTGASLAIDGSTAGSFSTSGDLDVSNGTQTVILEGTPSGLGVFDVIQFGGALSGDETDFVLQGAGSDFRSGTFTKTATSNGVIQLDIGNESHNWTGANGGVWDAGSAGAENWDSSDNLFYNGDVVTFGDTGAGLVTITGADVTPASVAFNNSLGNNYTIGSAATETLTAAGGISLTGSGDVTIDSVITGATSIDHNGTGTLTLNAENSFTGGTTVRSGATLSLGNPSGDANPDLVLGDASQGTALTIESGGTLEIGVDTRLWDYGTASIKVQGSGVGGQGAIVKTTGGTFDVFRDELDFVGDTTIRNTARLDINGVMTNSSGSRVTVSKLGVATIFLSTSQAGSGIDWDVQEGQITMEGGVDSSAGSTITVQAGAFLTRNQGSVAAGDVVLNGGSLRGGGSAGGLREYTESIAVMEDSIIDPNSDTRTVDLSGPLSGSKQLTLNNGITRFSGDTSGFAGRIVINSAAGVMEVAGVDHTIGSLRSSAIGIGTVQNNNANDATLTVGVDNTADATFAGIIQDGAAGGTLSIVKSGSGTQTLSGANTYTGSTTVSGGILSVSGDQSLASGAVTVETGGTLGGTGTLGGMTTVESGGTLTGGIVGDVGTLSSILRVAVNFDLVVFGFDDPVFLHFCRRIIGSPGTIESQ